MQVKIVDVKLMPKAYKGQVTNYYFLTSDSGKQYKVSEKSRYTFQNVQGVGLYDVEVGDYMGHEVVKKLKPLQTAGLDTVNPTTVASAPVAKASPAVETDKARLDFAAAKQNEIKLECYAGIAKDVLIANGKKDITAKDVMQFAKDLMLLHNDIIALGESLPGYGVDFLKDIKEAFPEAYVEGTVSANKKPEQQQFSTTSDEEVPF